MKNHCGRTFHNELVIDTPYPVLSRLMAVGAMALLLCQLFLFCLSAHAEPRVTFVTDFPPPDSIRLVPEAAVATLAGTSIHQGFASYGKAVLRKQAVQHRKQMTLSPDRLHQGIQDHALRQLR